MRERERERDGDGGKVDGHTGFYTTRPESESDERLYDGSTASSQWVQAERFLRA
jgi:hypothetical protein